MNSQLPYETGRQISNTFDRVNKQQKEENTIDKVLSEALASNNPKVFESSIAQILSKVSPENQKGAIDFLTNRSNQLFREQEKAKTSEAYRKGGYREGLEYLPEGLQKEEIKNKNNKELINNFLNSGKNPNESNSGNLNPLSLKTSKIETASNGMTREQLTPFLNDPATSKMAESLIGEIDLKEKSKSKKDDLRVTNNYKTSNDALERANKLSNSVKKKENAIAIQKEAVKSGKLDFWSLNNLADVTGIDWLRDPNGAMFKTASKEFLFGNLERVSAKGLNQWLEKQALDAQAKIGQDMASNLIVLRTQENEADLERIESQLTNDIYNDYMSLNGEPPQNLTQMVNNEVSKYADEKQIEMFNDFRAIKAIQNRKFEPYKNVKQGTIASDYMVQALLKQYGNNANKVRSELKKLGYAEE